MTYSAVLKVNFSLQKVESFAIPVFIGTASMPQPAK